MEILDLFSGIGGFSLSLERASKNFKTIAFCEMDVFCTQILNKYWPDVPVYPDIRELTYEKLKADGVAADSVCDGLNTSEQGIVPPGKRPTTPRQDALQTGGYSPIEKEI
jgi:DNA (cytosine-5)-methyltransferase 1